MLENSKPRHKLRRIPFVDEELSTIIQRQKVTLDRLVKQNSDSKNLIDKLMQGTGKTKFMISSEKQLLELEDELRKITIRLDGESKRYEVLKELVSIMNNEDKKSKKEEFLEINRLADQREKRLKKQEYDIQQILQKNNQVIAKINILKEQISSSRRERVVYSNLFKKIQKQIKIYEQNYKEILMEAHEYEKKQKVVREEMSSKKKSQRQPSNEHQQDQDYQDHEQMEFLPAKRAIDIESIHVEHPSPPSLPRRNPNMIKTSAMMDSLNELKIFFDILKSETGQESISDLIQTLPQYSAENEQLLSKIEEIDNQIISQSQELKVVFSGITQRQYSQNYAGNDQFAENQSLMIQNQIKAKTLEVEGLSDMLKDIGLLLNIPQDQVQIQTIFQLIENKLESLNPEQRKQSAQSQTFMKKLGENETHIQSVIEKMDCYNESEKILSKHYLETESIRELSKHKRLTKSRK